jgi:hypothetical protein
MSSRSYILKPRSYDKLRELLKKALTSGKISLYIEIDGEQSFSKAVIRRKLYEISLRCVY